MNVFNLTNDLPEKGRFVSFNTLSKGQQSRCPIDFLFNEILVPKSEMESRYGIYRLPGANHNF